jgi:hypothetical protein
MFAIIIEKTFMHAENELDLLLLLLLLLLPWKCVVTAQDE